MSATALTASPTDALDGARAALSKTVFFVVGCQKSGTTWVQKLLDGHPAVRCHGEAYLAPVLLPALQQALNAYNPRHKAGPEGMFSGEDLKALFAAAAGLRFAAWIGDNDAVEAVGEKTPEHALCLTLLAEVFPTCRVIHVVRDPRDVCVSGWFHNLKQKGEDFTKRFPDLAAYIRYTVTQHWLPYVQQAQAWGAQHSERYAEVQYEQLLKDPAGHARTLLELLSVDASDAAVDACLHAGAGNRQAAPAGGAQTSGSFFRKGVAGDWRNHFSEHESSLVHDLAGDLMRELGYEAG